MPNVVTITEEAKEHLLEICDNQKENNSVAGGGCAGFSYKWGFIGDPDKDDEVVNIDSNKNLIIDGMSIMHLLGMEIDYKKDIFGSILHIENPNVTSSCGCGESFNVF